MFSVYRRTTWILLKSDFAKILIDSENFRSTRRKPPGLRRERNLTSWLCGECGFNYNSGCWLVWVSFPRIFTSFTVNCKIMMYGRDVDRNDNRAATEVVAMFLWTHGGRSLYSNFSVFSFSSFSWRVRSSTSCSRWLACFSIMDTMFSIMFDPLNKRKHFKLRNTKTLNQEESKQA